MCESKQGTPSIEEIVVWLEEQQDKCMSLLNENYMTDSGHTIDNYFKGQMNSFTEALSFIKGGKSKPYGENFPP